MEYYADSLDELSHKTEALESRLRYAGLGYACVRADEEAEQAEYVGAPARPGSVCSWG